MSQGEKTSGWVKLGAETIVSFAVASVVLSAVGGLVLAGPVSQLLVQLMGEWPSWVAAELWSTVVLLAIIFPSLVVYAHRPAEVNLLTRQMRVGWRTASFEDLRHAYRLPGGTTDDSFIVQLQLRSGLDARLPLSTELRPLLTARELETLLRMLEQAPIQPDPMALQRPPVAQELGHRSSVQRIADSVGSGVMPYGRVTYAKETLLLEVRGALEARRVADAHDELAGMPEPSAARRIWGAALTGLRNSAFAPPHQPTARGYGVHSPEPDDPDDPENTREPVRGFFGMMRPAYHARRDAVEAWLAGVPEATQRDTATGWWGGGLLLVVVGLVLPWWFLFFFLSGLTYYLPGREGAVSWGLVVSLIGWPVATWAGLTLMWWSRIRYFAQVRAGALDALSRGAAIPGHVARFFGPPYPEAYLALRFWRFTLAAAVFIAIAGIVLLVMGSIDRVTHAFAMGPWDIPFGATLVLTAVVLVVVGSRIERALVIFAARAQVEGDLLAMTR